MRPHLRRPFVLAALLLLPLGGCILAGIPLAGAGVGVASAASMPDTSRSRYRVGSALTVKFDAPRAIVAAGRTDSLRVADATVVTGRVQATRGDTLWLAVAELRSARGGRLPFRRGREPVAAIVPDDATHVEAISRNASAVERGAIGAALGFIALVVGIALHCRGGCLN